MSKAAEPASEFFGALARELSGFRAPFAEYADDVLGFAFEVLLVPFLTDEQKEVLLSVQEGRETNVQAGHGVGKTFLAAILVLWWVFAVGGRCVTTAPGDRQVKELLWGEIRKFYDLHESKFGGRRTEKTVRLNEDARALGFKAPDYNPSASAGYHHPKLLVIIDEANGISQTLDDSASSWASGANNKLLRIGNPIAPGTAFEKNCRKTHIRISVFSHPNVSWAYGPDHQLRPEVAEAILTTNSNGVRVVRARHEWPDWIKDAHLDEDLDDAVPGAVSIEWIEDTARRKGEESDYWLSRALGMFPSSSPRALISAAWFQAARDRFDADPEKWLKLSQQYAVQIGGDVGDGSDSSGCGWRRGPVLFGMEELQTKGDGDDNTRTVAMLLGRIRSFPGARVIAQVDRVGVGAGVFSTLRKQRRKEIRDLRRAGRTTKLDWEVQGINPGFRSIGREAELYGNLRAQMFIHLRELFRRGEIAIAPLGRKIEDRLREELTGTEWGYSEDSGKLMIEKKKEIIKRIGRSPNLADTLAYAFFYYSDSEKEKGGKKKGGARVVRAA